MSYGPTGRDGKWPHADSVQTFLRHRHRETSTVRDVASHEAGHVVVAHAVGLPSIFVTARVSSEGEGHHRLDLKECSSEARLRAAFGGRAADERSGCFKPVRFDVTNADEMTALRRATMLANGDPVKTAEILVEGLEDARKIVAARQSDHADLRDELARRDLDGDDVERILGERSPSVWKLGDEAAEMEISIEVIDAATLGLLNVLPYGIVLVPGLDDRIAVAVWNTTAGVPASAELRVERVYTRSRWAGTPR